MKLTKSVETEILKHAQTARPSESCGFVLRVGRKQVYRPSENIAANPAEFFEIAAQDWIDAAEIGEILAVVHSHPQGEPFLSGADRQMQIQTALPWLLVVDGKIKVFQPCAHLRGRVFAYGRYDCAAIIRDSFMLMGIDLPDRARGEMDSDVSADVLARHLQAECGFAKVAAGLDDLVAGDVVLTTLGGNANHAALYLGGGEMLHHAFNQLSRREPFSRFWRDYTHTVLRHKDFEPSMMTAVFNDLAHSEWS